MLSSLEKVRYNIFIDILYIYVYASLPATTHGTKGNVKEIDLTPWMHFCL